MGAQGWAGEVWERLVGRKQRRVGLEPSPGCPVISERVCLLGPGTRLVSLGVQARPDVLLARRGSGALRTPSRGVPAVGCLADFPIAPRHTYIHGGGRWGEGGFPGLASALTGPKMEPAFRPARGVRASVGAGLVLALDNSLFPGQATDRRGTRGREAAGEPHPPAAAAGGFPEEPGAAAAGRPPVCAQLVTLRPAEPAAVV